MNSSDPYHVLGVAPESDDATIRRRYLELIKQFPPEHHGEKFSAIREAYEQLRDLDSRVRLRLFEQGDRNSIDQIAEEIGCQMPRRRFGLKVLLQAQQVR